MHKKTDPPGSRRPITPPVRIYLAQMPDCFGYGLCVMDTTESGAERALQRAYRGMKRDFGTTTMSYKEALEYFGGGVEEIELGKVYNDGFKL